MLVPTLHCDLSAPGNVRQRPTNVPFTNVIGNVVATDGTVVVVVVVVVVVGAGTVVVEVVVLELVVVLDVGKVVDVVVVDVVVVVVGLVGSFNSSGR